MSSTCRWLWMVSLMATACASRVDSDPLASVRVEDGIDSREAELIGKVFAQRYLPGWTPSCWEEQKTFWRCSLESSDKMILKDMIEIDKQSGTASMLENTHAPVSLQALRGDSR